MSNWVLCIDLCLKDKELKKVCDLRRGIIKRGSVFESSDSNVLLYDRESDQRVVALSKEVGELENIARRHFKGMRADVSIDGIYGNGLNLGVNVYSDEVKCKIKSMAEITISESFIPNSGKEKMDFLLV